MGSTIGIRVRSKRELKAMQRLMLDYYRPWSVVAGSQRSDSITEPTNDLSYQHGKLAFGVDYGAGLYGWEREYAYTLIRWLAIRVGATKQRFTDITPAVLPEPVPYLIYDGFECWPILVGTKADARKRSVDTQWCCTDKYGFHNGTNYPEGFVQHFILDDDEALNVDFKKAEQAAGPYPLHDSMGAAKSAWRQRVNAEALKSPVVQASITKHTNIIRSEMKRLDRLWRRHAKALSV